MYIDTAKDLWVPVAQMSRSPGMNRIITEVRWPITIYKMKVDAGPVVR